MNKHALIGIIVLLAAVCIVEGFVIYHERSAKIAAMNYSSTNTLRMNQQPLRGLKKPVFLTPGQKFSDNPLSKKAYLIFPVTGDLSADAKKALTGWDVKTTDNPDGSTQVDLIPHEKEDIRQSFTLKAGYKLYFIEMTLVDDTTGTDENRGDDIGVLVDSNDTIQ